MLVMRLSARADYALRAAIELAAATDSHVTADRIARAQQIPGKFLETILTQLRRAGLIRSQRGPEGGFWLARPASEISLAEIIRAIDGPLLGVRGERPENIEYPGAAEPLQQVWIALRANERAILEQVTLGHIIAGELPASVQLLTDNPKAWILPSGPREAGPRIGVSIGVSPDRRPLDTRTAGAVPPRPPPAGICTGPVTPAPCRSLHVRGDLPRRTRQPGRRSCPRG